MIIQTLGILVKNDSVLLGMKKRGFGTSWWNGFGGHVEKGESREECFRREALEETSDRENTGIVLKNIEQRGLIYFHFPDKNVEVSIYHVHSYEGEPKESEEMRWEWFQISKIPYDRMWPADRHWIPLFIKGDKFIGEVHFDGNKQVISHRIYPVSSLPQPQNKTY